MRRFIAILLLLLMPVQFAFAAAAPYCATEKAEAPAHFGHHGHPDDVAPMQDEGKDNGQVPSDCGTCHLGSVQTPALIPALLPPPQAALLWKPSNEQRPQHLQEPSERPPRPSLA